MKAFPANVGFFLHKARNPSRFVEFNVAVNDRPPRVGWAPFDKSSVKYPDWPDFLGVGEGWQVVAFARMERLLA